MWAHRREGERSSPSISRAAAIDVAKDTGKVCTRLPHPDKPGRRIQRTWQVTARYADVVAPMGELAGLGIQRLVLECTGHWRIWYYLPEVQITAWT
jgi:transposase